MARQLDTVGTPEYDSRTGTYHVDHDRWAADSVGLTVVSAVADVAGVEPVDLDPLHDCVEPDALDALFAPDGDRPRDDGYVWFSLDGHEVTVYANGHVVIRPADDPAIRGFDPR